MVLNQLEGANLVHQEGVWESGNGLVVVERVDRQELRNVDVHERDVAVGVKRHLETETATFRWIGLQAACPGPSSRYLATEIIPITILYSWDPKVISEE